MNIPNPMRHSQSGMALIAVLLFLILIAIAGAIAVRQSGMDLRVATSDQADALMLNASDGVLAHIETVADNPNDPKYRNLMSQTRGVLGYFIPVGGSLADPNEKVGWQVRFCYSSSSADLFNLSRSRILQVGGGIVGTGADRGRCEANKTTSYVSARNTVMTQVITRGMTGQTADTNNFKAVPTGQQAGINKSVPSPRIAMHSVSTLPALSNASNDDINTCMDKAVGDVTNTEYGTFGDENMTHCLQRAGVPATAVVEEGVIAFDRQGCDAQTVVNNVARGVLTC